MKIYYCLIIVLFISIISPLKAEDDQDSIRLDESIEDYRKRINKAEEVKNIETIKVIASKDQETYNGSYIITQDMISKSGAISVADILQQQPSIYIQSSGEFGQPKTVKLNGSHSSHVVILLDGVKLDDPSSAQSFFDIGQIPLSFVEEIEIIKGPSSVMYGSGAVAGVINIKTKKYKENQVSIKQELGSNNTISTQVGTNVSIGNFNLTLFGNFFKTDGYSLANEAIYGNTLKDDKSQVQDINLKLNYAFSEYTYIDSLFRIGRTEADYDGYNFVPIEADNHLNKQDNFYYLSYNFRLFSSFQNQVKFSQYISKRSYKENQSGSLSNYDYNAKEQMFTYKGSYDDEYFSFTGGIDFETKKMNIDGKGSNDLSFYGDIKEEITDKLSIEQGLRIDQNQRNLSFSETKFKNIYSYSFGASYDIEKDTYLKLMYGKSYRLPSLYELFGDFGNSILKEENSQGINLELSSDNFTTHVQQFNLNLFYTKVDNMIYFNNGRYSNIGNYTNLGFNVAFPFYIADFFAINDLKITPTYSYTDSKNKYDNYSVIPKHKFNTNFDLDLTEKYHLSWNTQWVSATGVTINNKKERLHSYWLNNAMVSANLKNNSKIYFKIDNIFNAQYQTDYGYNTKDRSYYLGIILEM